MIQDFLDHMRAQGASANTIYVYKWALEKAVSMVGKPLDDMAATDLDKIRLKLRQELPGSVGPFDSALRKYLRWGQTALEKPKWRDWADLITSKRAQQSEPHALTTKEVNSLIHAAEASTDRLRDRALVLTLYSTGMRMGEACGNRINKTAGIQIGDVKWDTDPVSVEVNAKGGRREMRYFIIREDEAVQALKEYIGRRQKGAVFRFSADMARHFIKALGRRAGVKVHPHLFRHTFVTRQTSGGVILSSVQKGAGHRDISTTQRYVHMVYDDMAHARNIMKEMEKRGEA